jgi:multicomponent Na+:H+ antiporter subunit E
MSELLRPRRLVNIIVLTVVWCGLWQDVSAANLLAGVAIGIGVTSARLGPPSRGGMNPVALVKLGLLVLVDLVRSTVSVASEILTPTDYTEEAIVAVTVPDAGRQHLLLLTIAITLTPGTAVVDTDPDTGTLYLHLLHQDKREETVAHAQRLVRLACEALPTNDEGARA